MHKMTEQNMIDAFGGESQAHMRYLHFAVQAEKENFPNVARLFKAVSYAEYIHAGNHYSQLKHLDEPRVANSMAAFGPGDTIKNLKHGIEGESFEIEEMYPVYLNTALFQEETGPQRTLSWAYNTEKVHKSLYEKALESVEAGNDVELGPVQICPVCGFTHEGEAPDICPLCSAKKDQFKTFAEKAKV